jgi:2-methylisocitrate lyase-like PEP mutase family enzyme
LPTIEDKINTLRELHESGCFVIPNPWDPGSAKYLQSVGFRALATTSAGFAFTRGRPDGGVSRDEMLAHLADIAEATDLPVSADFLNGYGEDPDQVAESVRLALATGIAGLSVEDSTGDPEQAQFDLETATERVRAARRVIDESGSGAVLTARAENFFVGNPDLDDTITRLRAYAEAGADCLYAPAIQTDEQIAAVVSAVAPKPVNVLNFRQDLTVADYAERGVRRISIGGGLAFAAWAGVFQAASRLAESGSFDGFPTDRPPVNLNALFAEGAAPA